MQPVCNSIVKFAVTTGLSFGDDRWVLDLLSGWASDSSRLAHPRVSPMFSRLADTVDEDREESAEAKAFRAAMTRLETEKPDVYALLCRLTRPGAAWMREDEPAVVAGVRTLAQWVDATMGDE